ncbi:MAG: hypothetical protein AAF728_03525 [Cyanobacteria bacterium P01_D01_bin.128]
MWLVSGGRRGGGAARRRLWPRCLRRSPGQQNPVRLAPVALWWRHQSQEPITAS